MPLLVTFLRACLFSAYFFALTLVMGLGSLPLRAFRRNAALAYAQLWTRLSVAGFKRICGVEVRVTGLDHVPRDAPCIIASQHQSVFDTLVWMNLVARPTYVMKKELTKLPLVGPMLLLSGMIPVEREAGSKALRQLLGDTARAAAEGRQIIIFPEGTRTRPGERRRLQPGIVAMARQGALPVIPVATDSGFHWPRAGLLKHPGIITIAIGPPLRAGATKGALLADIAREWDMLSAGTEVGKSVENSVGANSARRSDGIPQGSQENHFPAGGRGKESPPAH
jgi:1-acyl-sn-glycerol-3-phosphate acyltransferase